MKQCRRFLILSLLALVTAMGLDAQTAQRITGLVVDERGEALPGVQVIPVGATASGTVTDIEGRYTVSVPKGITMLEFSFIGMKTERVTIAGRSKIDITLREEMTMLEGVVVTALGIKRAEKALSYNVQQIKSEELLGNKDANFINALSGKVAGVNINSSSSGTGGASKVVMRGTKSILQSSNALYVIDGIPVFPPTREGGMEFASQGSSEPIADINPEDIESMSVLTGAAAAALYGSAAANGAIVITTKQGKRGVTTLSISSKTELTEAFVLPRMQDRYGTGSGLQGTTTGVFSWGKALNEHNRYAYDPGKDYLRMGIIATEAVSLSTGTERNQTYLSASAVNAKGIVPNNAYNRYNFTARNTSSMLGDKMLLDLGASYIYQSDRNMLNQGVYGNPLIGAYLHPRGSDWDDTRLYERYDPIRKIYTQHWPHGDAGYTMQNPYWINYRNLKENTKHRYMLSASLSYDVLDGLKLMGRARIDHASTNYEERLYASTFLQLTANSDRGYYGTNRIEDKQLYLDALASYNKSYLEGKLTLNANLGASLSDMRSDALGVFGPIPDGTTPGEEAGLTNFFTTQQLSKSKTTRPQSGWAEQTQAVYGSVEIGYRNAYFLTLTARNDWPSQLAGPRSVRRSFAYPSVGFSVLLSEVLSLPKAISYLKLRGSYASVGLPFKRFLANPQYEWDGSLYKWSNTTVFPVYNLLPERTKSYELGLSARFLRGFELEATYYLADTHNQTFDPKLSSGASSRIYIQTGAVRNSGVELSLNYKGSWGDLSWQSGLTYSANKNKILVLADNAINPETGERFSLSTLDMGGLGAARFLLKKGGSMGDLYSRIDLMRDDKGNVLVSPDGSVAPRAITEEQSYIKLGNVAPKANMAWRNSLSYKGLGLSFLISARLGGVVFSRTQAVLDHFGTSEASAQSRDRGFVRVNGGDYLVPEQWYSVVGGSAIPQHYTYSATNVRLQELSLSYSIPRKRLANLCDLTISLTGRNLWMIYNHAPYDPESVASTGNFYDGIDYFMMPSLRSVGLNLNLKF